MTSSSKIILVTGKLAKYYVENYISDSHITKFYERLKERKPNQLAIISTARKILKTIFLMLKK